MAPTLISNPVTSSDRARRSTKKKRSQHIRDQTLNGNNNDNSVQWKSEAQQQLYSSKLVQALRQVRLSSSPSAQRGGRAVREAAYRVLAVTAKGKTRWSRAILANRVKIKFMKNKRQRAVAASRNSRLPKKPRVSILKLKTKNLPVVQRKVRVLGRLVPGCRKEPLPVILDEATDYIAALEMQVRAMTALAQLLSGSNAGSGSSSNPLNQLVSNLPPPS